MYEMEGTSPGLIVPGRPVTWLPGTAGRPPGPNIRARRRFPESSRVPGSPPVMPVSSDKCIFTASAKATQGSAIVNFQFFRYPHGIHRTWQVIRIWRPLSTLICTIDPQDLGITRENDTRAITSLLCHRCGEYKPRTS